MNLRLQADGIDLDIVPSEISWQSKLGAVTTFTFPYPNDSARALGIFREQKTLVTILAPGMSAPLLEGFVIENTNESVAKISCADPMYFLSNVTIPPETLKPLVTMDIARVIAELVTTIDIGDSAVITERVVGTNPNIPLPADFITEPTHLDELIKKLVTYVKEQTIERFPDENITYFIGFIAGTFRFERLPNLDTEDAHFTLIKDINLFEEMPEYHFDRVVNRARAYGKVADEDTVIGPLYEDLHSVVTYGVKEPEDRLELETGDTHKLFLRARHEVLKAKDLQVTRNVDLPFTPWVTPGLYNVDVVRSAYGAEGKSRVIQVQGGIGPSGRIRLQLGAIPLDEGEVLKKVVLGTDR